MFNRLRKNREFSKRTNQSLDVDYVIENFEADHDSVWNSDDELDLDEIEQVERTRSGRTSTVVRTMRPKLSGFSGYNTWNTKYRFPRRPAVSEAAFNRAKYNKRINMLHGFSFCIDPVKVEYFLKPFNLRHKGVNDVLEDFKKDGLPPPYIEYTFSNGSIPDTVWVVNDEPYSSYIGSRKIDKENLIRKKQAERLAKHIESGHVKAVGIKPTKQGPKSGLGKFGISVVLLISILAFASSSQLNGTHGEFTGTDDVALLMEFENLDFTIFGLPGTVPRWCKCDIENLNDIRRRYFLYNQARYYDVTVLDGNQVRGVPGQFTCYVNNSEDPDVRSELTSEIKVFEHPACGIYQKSRYVVLKTVYTSIFEEFSYTAWSPHKAKQIARSVNRLCVGMPSTMVANITTCVMHAATIMHVNLRVNQNVDLATPPEYAYTSSNVLTALPNIPVVMYGISSPLPTYVLRDGAFHITGKGYRWRTTGGLNNDTLYPYFNSGPDMDHPKYKLSVFASIVGEYEFHLPDLNSANITAAMKRLLAVRSGQIIESIYRISQNEFYYHAIYNQRDTLECIEYTPDLPMPDLRPGRGLDPGLVVGGVEVDFNRTTCADYHTFAQGYLCEMVYRGHTVLEDLSYLTKYAFAEIYLGLCYLDDYGLLLTKTSLMPHSKQSQRLKFLEQYHNEAVARDNVNPVSGFKFELAKYGKCGRLFVSYGDLILLTAAVADFVKKTIGGVLYANQIREERVSWLPFSPDIRGSAVLVVTDTSIVGVTEAYNKMLYHLALARVGTSYSLVFSDDTSVGVKISETELSFANVDIASNDSGVDVGQCSLYHSIADIFNKHVSHAGFNSLTRPITVRNPDNPKEKIVLTPTTVFMGSGCAQTTGLNNIGNTLGNCVAHKMVEDRYERTKDFNLSYDFRDGFMTVGHEVTFELCDRTENLQFLKRSPFKCVDGDTVMCLNLGAILRSFGKIDGDLTHERLGITHKQFVNLSPYERAHHYLTGVIRGYVHEPANDVLDILRHKFNKLGVGKIETQLVNHELLKDEDPTNPKGYGKKRVLLESILHRYGLDEHLWHDFIVNLKAFDVGHVLNHRVCTHIYHYDYGTPL